MKKILLLFFLVIGLGAVASAQGTINITGKVTESGSGFPIPGVTVLIKGTTTGGTTDIDGNYRVVASANDIIVFSFIGMKTQEVNVDGRLVINIALENQDQDLDEVVVIGYGVQRKSDLTGSVGSVKGKDLAKTPTLNVGSAISGKVAGVQVTSTEGRPGASPVVRIRGVGTLNDASPIYVVDGLIVSDISFLNSADIASLEVLKDASATAIYGSRGANGVILISTKQGATGKTKIDFNSHISLSQVSNTIDMVSASDYAMLRNESSMNAGGEAIFEDPSIYGKGTDWFDEIYSTALSQNYQISASGGNDKMKYHLSAGYEDQEGIVEKTDLEKITLRANNEYTLTKHFKVGHNISFIKTDKHGGPDPTETAYRSPGIYTPYQEDGSFTEIQEANNPLVATYYNNSLFESERLLGNFYGELKVGDLLFRSSYGFEKKDNYNRAYVPEYVANARQSNDISKLTKVNLRYRSYIWDNTINYFKDFKNHHFDAMAGISVQDTKSETLKGFASDIPSNSNLWYLDATFNSDSESVDNYAASWSYLSYMFRINYSYLNRYLLTATYRIDGSSKFSEGNRYGHFPSVALGWRVSEEDFLKDHEYISNLKLRASWGVIGNDKIGNYASIQSLSTTEKIGGNESGIVAIVGGNEDVAQGATLLRLADPTIVWEETAQTDVGMEIGFFNNKLSAELDYYRRETDDILIAVPIPSYFGTKIDPVVNAAKVLNDGFEVILRWEDRKGDFSYGVSANLTSVNNEVTELAEGRSFLTGSVNSQTFTRTSKGHPIGSFYGFKVDGVFQNAEELASYPVLGGEQPGDLRFKDLNGDGEITEDDQTIIGSPIPDFTYGVNLHCEYKGFDFSLDLQGVYGNEIANGKIRKRWDSGYNYEASALDRWHGEGTSYTNPRLNDSDTHNEKMSDYWLEDGSYLRIRNVQLGYTLPKALTQKISLSRLRAYISVTDLYTFTDYSGFTPDIGGGNVLANGVDMGTYPLPTTFTFGLNLTF
ncbi:MAG: SusC/RagA family TonB-linked outer membrane protein [Marinifilaceae bacterium]